MEPIKHFAINHVVAIIFAVLVSLCMGLPALLAPYLIGDDYRGVLFITNNDEQTYLARIREVLDGHTAVFSPNLYEYKDVPGLLPAINEYPYVFLALLFGIPSAVILGKFIFPGILFLLFYLLTYALLKNSIDGNERVAKWTSTASGLLAILGMDALSFRHVASLFTAANGEMFSLTWTRLVHPIIGGLFLFTFLIFLWRLVDRPSRHATIFTGVIPALSVGYFFSFGLGLSVLGSLGLLYLFLRDRGGVLRVATVFIVTIVAAVPYWYLVIISMGGEDGRALAAKNGMFFTHEPVLNKFLLATTVFAVTSFIFVYLNRQWKERVREWIFVAALVLGCWVAYNQQIVTGREIWIGHFTQYTVPIGFIVVVAVSFLVWRKCFPKIYELGIAVMIVGCMSVLFLSSASSRFFLDQYRGMQKDSEIYSFLNENAPKDCVVLIREERDPLEQKIPANTHCNSYSTDYIFSGVPKERVLHNFLLRLRLNGVTKDNVREYLLSHPEYVRQYLLEDWTHNFGIGVDDWVLGSVDMVEREYQLFFAGDIKQQLLRFRVDYLASRELLPEDILRQLPGISMTATSSGYYLYSFAQK